MQVNMGGIVHAIWRGQGRACAVMLLSLVVAGVGGEVDHGEPSSLPLLPLECSAYPILMS